MLNIFNHAPLIMGGQLQDRETAVTEGRDPPALSGSADIRPLNMEDFKFAHDRVSRNLFEPLFLPCHGWLLNLGHL